MNAPSSKGRRFTATIIDDPGKAPDPTPAPDPRVASLASPDAQARALEAESLLARAEALERDGFRYVASVLRKREEKTIGRAGVSEARARGAEEAGRARYPVTADNVLPPGGTKTSVVEVEVVKATTGGTTS